MKKGVEMKVLMVELFLINKHKSRAENVISSPTLFENSFLFIFCLKFNFARNMRISHVEMYKCQLKH